VSSSIVCTLSEYVVPPFGPGLVLKAGKPAVCANESVGSASIIAGNTTGNATGVARRKPRTAARAAREVIDVYELLEDDAHCAD